MVVKDVPRNRHGQVDKVLHTQSKSKAALMYVGNCATVLCTSIPFLEYSDSTYLKHTHIHTYIHYTHHTQELV